jgi:hypothetical protein
VPLVLRDKLAAILYCDTVHEEVAAAEADLIEILVSAAGKTIDILSLAPKPAPGRATTAGTTPERAAAIRGAATRWGPRGGARAAAPPPKRVPAPCSTSTFAPKTSPRRPRRSYGGTGPVPAISRGAEGARGHQASPGWW